MNLWNKITVCRLYFISYGFKANAHHIKKRCFGGRYCYARKDLTDTLQTCFKVWRDFYVLFSGSNLSAHATQNWLIHSISRIGRKPVKKIPAHATLLLTMKPEVESLLNRICISYNRRGHRTFAVFLLSFFIGMCRRAVSGIHCRSPPSPSGF